MEQFTEEEIAELERGLDEQGDGSEGIPSPTESDNADAFVYDIQGNLIYAPTNDGQISPASMSSEQHQQAINQQHQQYAHDQQQPFFDPSQMAMFYGMPPQMPFNGGMPGFVPMYPPPHMVQQSASASYQTRAPSQNICRRFPNCPYGDRCRFLHVEQDGSVPPEQPIANEQRRPSRALCRYFPNCHYGDKCKFHHPETAT